MIRNPYGMRDGQLVCVEDADVPNGLACNCTCPACGHPLVAKKAGRIMQPHFAHASGSDCGAGYETAVHLMAKDILARKKRIMLPYLDLESSKEIQVPRTLRKTKRIVERQRFSFDRVELERWMEGNRVPDVVLWKGKAKLLVEIVVTHGIDAEKLQWIKKNNHSTMTVHLGMARAVTREELTEILLDGYHNGLNVVRWVHNSKTAAEQAKLDAEYLKNPPPAPVVESVAIKRWDICDMQTERDETRDQEWFVHTCKRCGKVVKSRHSTVEIPCQRR